MMSPRLAIMCRILHLPSAGSLLHPSHTGSFCIYTPVWIMPVHDHATVHLLLRYAATPQHALLHVEALSEGDVWAQMQCSGHAGHLRWRAAAAVSQRH